MLSAPRSSLAAFLISSFFVGTFGQLQPPTTDPIGDFCRRFAHQTAVIDNKLFIDGGLVDYGGGVDTTTENYTNTYLLYLDLDDIGPYNFSLGYANLSKPSYVPSVHGGVLWADDVNKFFYLYGGEYNWTTAPPVQSTLWAYDAVYNNWTLVPPDASASDIQSVSFGASAVIDDRALAYYYGGWQSNATVLGWEGSALAQSGLIEYDMVANTWQNLTFIDSTPRAEGTLYYIPASDQGMLVYLGGVQQTSNGSYVGVPMDQIYLYDLLSGRSYTQTTSGTPPDMRRRFCGGVSWPDDQSSYNIYFYGGLPPYGEEGVGYDDVWILSLPSFTWTQWFSASTNAHHSLSCNVIDQSQMIIMGGYFPNSSNIGCDSKNVLGQHNLNLGANNVENAEWYPYLPNITSYQVPTNITDVIGGGPSGGATLTTPAAGWDDPDLQVYFTQRYTPSSRSPTRALPAATSSPASAGNTHVAKHTAIAPVVGGAIGGVVALLALLVIGICLYRRRRRGEGRSQPQQPRPIAELQAPHPSAYDRPGSQHKGLYGQPLAPVVSELDAPSPPPFERSYWGQQVYDQHQQQYFRPYQEPQGPPQNYSPTPAQPYYPPPPAPQQYERPSTPMSEMSSVRSPVPRRAVSARNDNLAEK